MKFEYEIMRTDDVYSWRGSIAELNTMGQNGWELVVARFFNKDSEWIFKRHLTPVAPDSEDCIAYTTCTCNGFPHMSSCPLYGKEMG